MNSRSAMGNSPSSGLGSGPVHSSRDVSETNPEKEVKRPSASREPTHNVYTELLASSKPHNNTLAVVGVERRRYPRTPTRKNESIHKHSPTDRRKILAINHQDVSFGSNVEANENKKIFPKCGPTYLYEPPKL